MLKAAHNRLLLRFCRHIETTTDPPHGTAGDLAGLNRYYLWTNGLTARGKTVQGVLPSVVERQIPMSF